MTGGPDTRDDHLKVLRVAHSGVVGAWRERERALIARGVAMTMVSAQVWDEGGRPVVLDASEDDFVEGVRTWGRHPNVFLYDPRPLWRLLGEEWDLLDVHEEPCSLAVGEILALKWLRRSSAPYCLYSAQNILKRYPLPFRWIERLSLSRASGVAVCNVAAGQILKGKGLKARAAVIPLGVDLDMFAPLTRSGPSTSLSIGYAGRLAPHKGVDVLLRSIAEREDWNLSLAGAGPEMDSLKRLAEELGVSDRVDFLGPLDQSDLAAFYSTLDVVAVPSLRTPGWEEQFCRVAVEAMASGVPVVASRSGALPEVVGEAGVLVTPGDADALADAFDRLGRDRHLWERLRALGVQRADGYSWESVADSYLELYRAMKAPDPRLSGGEPKTDRAVEVVVVAYGDVRPLEICLEALPSELSLVVVDNSSCEATRRVVEARGGCYVDPGRNLGFAAGVNLALAHRRHPDGDVLLLNPDAVIDASALAGLRSALAADARSACAAPSQVDPEDGSATRVSWPIPSPWRAWLEAFGLTRLWGPGRFVIGAVLLIRAEALAEIGPFDERFFLYGEETDWQMRAIRAGWRVILADDIVATHVGAGTGGDPLRRETHFHASHERLIRKYYGPAGWAVCRAGCVIGAAARSLLTHGDKRALARLRLRLYTVGPVRAEQRLSQPGHRKSS